MEGRGIRLGNFFGVKDCYFCSSVMSLSHHLGQNKNYESPTMFAKLGREAAFSIFSLVKKK